MGDLDRGSCRSRTAKLRAARPGRCRECGRRPDKAGTCQYHKMVRVRRAWRKGIREEPASTCLNESPARTWWIWAGGDAHALPHYGAGNFPRDSRDLRGLCGDVLRGGHGEVAGTKSGASPAERSMSEHGNRLGPVTADSPRSL